MFTQPSRVCCASSVSHHYPGQFVPGEVGHHQHAVSTCLAADTSDEGPTTSPHIRLPCYDSESATPILSSYTEGGPLFETVLSLSSRALRESFLSDIYSAVMHDDNTSHDGPSMHHCGLFSAVPSPLRLQAHIAPPCFDLTKQQFPVGKTFGDVVNLLNGRPFELYHRLPADLQLHPTAKAALAHAEAGTQSIWELDKVEVFTDGSFSEARSAWACVVLGYAGGAVSHVAWAGDQVCVRPDSHKWVGATCHGAKQAELTAIVMTLWWSFSAGLPKHFCICSDSLSSVKRAEGAWQFPTDDLLALTCRSLFQTAQELLTVSWEQIQHVKGHSGVGWNELADALAKFVLSNSLELSVQSDIGCWVRTGDVAQLWLLVAASRDPESWPLHSGSHMIDTGIEFGDTPIRLFPGLRPLRRVGPTPIPTLRAGLRTSVISLNMLTPMWWPCRRHELPSRLSGNFIRLCSGASHAGQLGVEVWFCRCSEHQKPGFSADDLNVLFWDPGCLGVRVRSQLLDAIVVAVHALTAQDPTRNDWWKGLKRKVRSVDSGSAVCIIGDFNVRFDREVHSRIGGHVWPTNYEVPQDLYDMLEEQDLAFHI